MLVACWIAMAAPAAAQFPAMPPLPVVPEQPSKPPATRSTPPTKPAPQPTAKPAKPAVKRTQPTANTGQSQPPDDALAPTRAAASLAAKKVWPVESVPVFEDDGRNLRFDLATSWIRSADGKGMLRYQFTATPAPPSDAPQDEASIGSLDDQQQFLARATACDFTLVLYDSDRFELIEVPLTMKHGVDSEGNWRNLADNHIVRMDAEMYRTFLRGGYGVTWECNRGEGQGQSQ